MSATAGKKRVLSGMQPTGRMHIGHYFGALQNYVRMQDEYDAFYCVVDLHALTTFEKADELWPNVTGMVADWIAAGVDPDKATIFVQSHVPEVAELHWILSTTTPISWLERVPTFKEKSEQHPDNINYALLGYPVLQAADILLYEANKVPVGEDQLAHLELTREIARRFNHRWGQTFIEPKAELTSTPRVMGLDGTNKMSKSRDNYIPMTGEPDEIRKLVNGAVTDVTRPTARTPATPSPATSASCTRSSAPMTTSRSGRASAPPPPAASTSRSCSPTASSSTSPRCASGASRSTRAKATSRRCWPRGPRRPRWWPRRHWRG